MRIVFWAVSKSSASHPPESTQRNYRFALRPFWLFSHIFVSAALCLFVVAAVWQYDRWTERKEENALIGSRSDAEAIGIDEALQRPIDELDFVPVQDSGHFVESNLIRVANRSHNGEAGDWVVGLFETDDGLQILVNRGFSTRTGVSKEDVGDRVISGWLRASHVQEGFGAVDNGVSERVPRFDTIAIAERFDLDVPQVWLQLDDPNALGFPEPVYLPERNNGSHFSYMVQWSIFTVLTIGAYVLVLRKKSVEIPA